MCAEVTETLRPKLLDYTTDRQEMLYRSNEIFKWLGDGKLKVSVDKVFALDKVLQHSLRKFAGC